MEVQALNSAVVSMGSRVDFGTLIKEINSMKACITAEPVLLHVFTDHLPALRLRPAVFAPWLTVIDRMKIKGLRIVCLFSQSSIS